MATKKYNPYNSMKKIVDLKQSYDDAKSMNGNYQQYQNEATQYYNDLISNGYVQQAADLSKYGYEDALNYLNNSGWKSDEEMEFDEWYDSIGKVGTNTNEESELDKWVNDIGKVSTGDKRTISEQQSSYIDKLMGIGMGETSVKQTDTVNQMLSEMFGDNQLYNESYTQFQNNVMSGANNLLNYDYTKQPFYRPIMDSYNLYGQNAANGQLASGAAANSGNIDSYAAANAARQQLAFTNAGHQAALAAAAQNQGGWLDAYKLSKDALGDLRLKNADNQSTFRDVYKTDSEERQAANDVIRQLFGDESAERVNATNAMVDKYLADLGLVQTQYTTDSQERMNTANNEYGLALQKLANESGLSVAQIQAAVDNYKAQLGYESDLAGYGTQERMNTENNVYKQAIEQAKADSELELAKTNNKNERTIEEWRNQNALDVLEKQYALTTAQEMASAEYDADTIARNVIDGIEAGVLEIKSWDEFQKYLARDAGVPVDDAKQLTKSWKNLMPNLFSGSTAGTGTSDK